MRVVWLVVLVACSKEPRKEAQKELPARPQIRMSPVPAAPMKVRYAAKTENAANGSNPTFFNIVEDEGLFFVADGVPTTGDPAKLAAQSVTPLAGEGCKGFAPDVQLACALRRANDRVVTAKGGTASVAAVVVADGHAYAAISGTAWVVRIQGGTRELIVQSAREPLKPLGTSATAALSIYELDLEVGDTIAIVNRAVIDVLGPDGIARALPATFADPKALEAGVQKLVAAASRAADHSAVAVIVLHGADATAVTPPAVADGDGKLDCQALTNVIAIVEREPELTSLRGEGLGNDDFVAKLPVLRGRDALVRGTAYSTVLLREPGSPDASPSPAVVAAVNQLGAQVKECLPDWSSDPRSTSDVPGVRLQMPGAKGTRYVAARIAESDDLDGFQVTLRVNQLPTNP